MVMAQHKRRESEVITTAMVNDNFELSKYQDGVIARLCLDFANNG